MVGLGFLANAMLLVLGSEYLGVLTILRVDWEANPATKTFKTTRVSGWKIVTIVSELVKNSPI